MRQDNEKGVDYEGRHYTKYEATQRQRQLERSIRKQKRRILAAEQNPNDKERLQQAQIKYQVLDQEYKRFSKAAGLRLQHERMEMAGFGAKQARAADKTAKESKVSVNPQELTKTIDKTNHIGKKISTNSKNYKKEIGQTDVVRWDESRGVKSWREDKKKRLISAEYASVREPVENDILYDANGKRIFRKKGDGSSVEFTPSQIKQMRGGVLTHNHPGADYGCFSPADIDMLRESHLAEIRVATPAGVFSMQRPKRWPSSINCLEKIRDVYYDIDNTIGSDYWNRALRGEMSILDANNLGQHAVVEEMCKRYGIPFKFDSWDALGKESYESIL